MDALEAAGIDVGVALGGGDAGMAEHFLHMTEIDASGNQMGGEAVAERVRADVGRHAGCGGVGSHNFPDSHSGKTIAAGGEHGP